MTKDLSALRKKPKRRQYRNGLCKRGRYWWIQMKVRGQKIERSTGCTDRSDAILVRDALRRELELGGAGIEVPSVFTPTLPTLEEAARGWVRAHEGAVVPRYQEQMIELVERHFKKWKAKAIDEISTAVVEEARRLYLTNKAIKTLKGKTHERDHTVGGWNRCIRLLSALYGWAVKKRGYLKARPWTMSETKVQKAPRPVLWPEQVRPFLAAVDQHTYSEGFRLAVRLQVALGLRESEAATARWEWVNWRLKVYAPGLTKNRKTRQVPIPAWLFEVLESAWEGQGKPGKGPILPAPRGTKYNRGFSKNCVVAAGEEIGVLGLHPHRLRATFATAHWEAGTPLSKLQAMLGHENPSTTLRYVETRPAGSAEAQEKVAAAMGFQVSTPRGTHKKKKGA